ncbi:hypothetical protein R55227_BLOPHJLP_01635 [Fructobacillus tropaeoli]|uniref:phage replisome organizer N-terminal domain-containing protein n=1 Tax=Fructobacillus tropaeoli TaxID=709323 RepID=UPI002DA33586|nr:hypothetical protein R55227_BLOPHJLP_01635 [Fructobacillus tropaeoli]
MAKKKPIYFWLRLDNNFYKNLAIKKARKFAGGDTMIVIYQKMMLSSLETNGVIYYEGVYGKLEEELALMIDEDIEQVSMTLAYFTKSGLIQIDDEQNVEMSQVSALIDQETNWARYKREQRNKQKLDNVQQESNDRPTELEKELEKDIDTPLTPQGGDDVVSVNPAKEMLDIFNKSMNRNLSNSGLFSQLVMQNISVQEFKDVMNYIVDNWTEDIVSKFASSTLVKKFDQYSDKASEFGYRDGKRPKKSTRGKQEPKITTNADIQQQSQPKAQPPEDDPEDLMAILKGRKTSG